MSMSQFGLNKALYDAANRHDLAEVEALLIQGADPLGSTDEKDPQEHLLGELFDNAVYDHKLSRMLPQIVQLFLDHGMDIAARQIPNNHQHELHPLWSLSFLSDEHSIEVLRLLLDHGLDAISVEHFVEHAFIDMDICDGSDLADKGFYRSLMYTLRMVMLAASYPNILQNSPYICKCVDVQNNDPANLSEFRDWTKHRYHIDKSTCTNLPHGLLNATLTIRHDVTKEVLWRMKL